MTQVGVLFSVLLAGMAPMSAIVAVAGERIGRRRLYCSLFFLMAVSGALLGFSQAFPLLILAVLTGTLFAMFRRIKPPEERVPLQKTTDTVDQNRG